MAGLSDKQRAFCVAYLANGFNGAQAAVSAGYSEKSAAVQASRLLTYDNVRSYIQETRQKVEEEVLEALPLNLESVLLRLWEESQLGPYSTPQSRVSALKALQEHFTRHHEDSERYLVRIIKSFREAPKEIEADVVAIDSAE